MLFYLFQIRPCGYLQSSPALEGAKYLGDVTLLLLHVLGWQVRPPDREADQQRLRPVQVQGGLRAPPDCHMVVSLGCGR